MIDAFDSIISPPDIFTDAPEKREAVLDYRAALKSLEDHKINTITHEQWDLLRNAMDLEYGGTHDLDDEHEAKIAKAHKQAGEAIEILHEFLFGEGPCFSCDELDAIDADKKK